MENNNDNIIMSRLAFERMQSKDERNDRWRNIIIVLLIVLLVATNAMWLWAWNQYDYVSDDYSIEADQDGDGINLVSGGDLSYGTEGNGEKNNTEQGS